jgi:N-ethylmaleimide reductase
MVATYYLQRAEAGLIVTEGASPSPNDLGLAGIPGPFRPEQVRGRRKVTDAVHIVYPLCRGSLRSGMATSCCHGY